MTKYHTGSWTMKAIVVKDQAAGAAEMKLVQRPEPQAAINDIVVQVHAAGFVPWGLGSDQTRDQQEAGMSP
jgi:NADPH:quinone reductase-like Zn-dependent oxidoreductase